MYKVWHYLRDVKKIFFIFWQWVTKRRKELCVATLLLKKPREKDLSWTFPSQTSGVTPYTKGQWLLYTYYIFNIISCIHALSDCLIVHSLKLSLTTSQDLFLRDWDNFDKYCWFHLELETLLSISLAIQDFCVKIK